jgi:hypothetical protein
MGVFFNDSITRISMISNNTGVPHFIVVCLIYFVDTLFFRKSKFAATVHSAILSPQCFAIAYAHFMRFCHILIILSIFQTFKYWYISYGDL